MVQKPRPQPKDGAGATIGNSLMIGPRHRNGVTFVYVNELIRPTASPCFNWAAINAHWRVRHLRFLAEKGPERPRAATRPTRMFSAGQSNTRPPH